jgi:8-oxo-dGTP pyrophosphatase MutT (NUDIX family)
MVLTEAIITDRLNQALSGLDPSSHGYAEMDVTAQTKLRCAAVLIPLIAEAGAWRVLFTRRTDQVESHKGQVSFPGGGCDDGETTPEQTALREAHEEIGIDPASVRILGRLRNMVTITSFSVTPVVGLIPWPTVFRLSEEEVERVFTVPLSWLADARNRWELPFPGSTRGVVVYHPFDGELVWGATARMTVDLVKTLDL